MLHIIIQVTVYELELHNSNLLMQMQLYICQFMLIFICIFPYHI